DVDVHGPRREALRLRRAAGARAAERVFDGVHPLEQHARLESRLDRDHAVEVPGTLTYRASRLVLPRLRFVETGRGHHADLAARAQTVDGRAQRGEPIAHVRAQSEIDALHYRLRVISTPGVPTTPSSGAVILRTRT